MAPGALFTLGMADVIGLIALFVMLVSGEGTSNREPLRTVLGGLHGVLVLSGSSYVFVMTAELGGWPGWLQSAVAFIDLFSIGLVAVLVAQTFPARAPGGAAWPLWRTAFRPLGYTLLWGSAAAVSFHRADGYAEAGLDMLSFLGVHYALLTAAVVLELVKEQRRSHPTWDAIGWLPVVWSLALLVQAGYGAALLHERLFGSGAWGVLVSVALWGHGLRASIRDGRQALVPPKAPAL